MASEDHVASVGDGNGGGGEGDVAGGIAKLSDGEERHGGEGRDYVDMAGGRG